MNKYYTNDEYDDFEDSQSEEQTEIIDNKNYAEIEVDLIEKLKDIYYNVLLPEIEASPSILQKLNKYSEYSFINFFRNNSSYYKSIEEKQ
tara:strand:+ start:1293 stop:1562 length:270 start_codon:yes stop_codon:yes gene_type:complete